LDNRLRLNGTLFYNDYAGLQQTASIISPVNNTLVSVRANAGKAHTDGFELESIAEPFDGLTLTGNASYLWTRFDDFSNPGTSVNTGKPANATGNQLPFAPRWQLYAAAEYLIPPLPVPGTIRVGADVSYESSYFSDVFDYPQSEIHPQAYTDAHISYTPDNSHWTATLTGQNLGNRLAYQSLTWAGTRNLYQGPISPPFTIFFKLAYTY
jgi:iron complex outermembrane receptor protein